MGEKIHTSRFSNVPKFEITMTESPMLDPYKVLLKRTSALSDDGFCEQVLFDCENGFFFFYVNTEFSYEFHTLNGVD